MQRCSSHANLRGQQNILKMSSSIKEGFHIRNKHRSRYDFPMLINAVPQLKEFVKPNPYGDDSINWANATAVTCLNKALLVAYYSVEDWVIPQKFLTPPVPSRADYIHHVADLIHTYIPPTATVRCLDIGTGANCIYPLIGHAEYKWHFVGTDVDSEALEVAQNIVTANKATIGNRIQFRQQPDPQDIFLGGVIRSGEKFACSVCNPPFHATEVRKKSVFFISFFSYTYLLSSFVTLKFPSISLLYFHYQEEAREGSIRKWKNLNLAKKGLVKKNKTPVLNFGGQTSELIYPGGEMKFLLRMIRQSGHPSIRNNVLWFTTLVSKAANLDTSYRFLEEEKIDEHLTVEMIHGNKKSRIIAWTFIQEKDRQKWVENYLQQ